MRALRTATLLICALAGPVAADPEFQTIDTPASGRTIEYPAVVVQGGTPNVFVMDRDLGTNLARVKWCQPSPAGCSWTVIDGANNDLVIAPGYGVEPIVYGDSLHLFYINKLTGAGVLRHAMLWNDAWYFETVDGDGGANGRVVGDLSGELSVAEHTNRLHVAYRDNTRADLRLASTGKLGWTFQVIDGDGGPGRTTDNVGVFNTLVVHNGELNAIYSNLTNADLIHARRVGTTWQYQTLDGGGQHTTDYVVGSIAAVVSGPWLHVMYNRFAVSGIVHAWSAGGGWGYADHDNGGAFTTGAGCTSGNQQMFFPYAVGAGDRNLKLTGSWSSSPWWFATWDGHVADAFGRIDASVGLYSSCAGATFGVYVVYTHDLGGGRKAIRYASTVPPV
jgi:hypothetical protein